MALPFFHGPEASLWLGMLLCQTHMQKHVDNSASQAGAAASLAANNKATKYDQLTGSMCLSSGHWNDGYQAPPGNRTGRGDCKCTTNITGDP